MAYLEGKAVIVTGAGRGIGRAYAHLASREGASVVVNDIDADVAEAVTKEIVRDGGTAVTAVADVGDWAGAESVIDRASPSSAPSTAWSITPAVSPWPTGGSSTRPT